MSMKKSVRQLAIEAHERVMIIVKTPGVSQPEIDNEAIKELMNMYDKGYHKEGKEGT